ncbi:MAG TPA: universal stress protein [Thermomicrobiales bacterium]|jgi:nucleotide-binding universal stress UspA family protein|nr:universal stress protein [Thermomicrobiales bacterium]
MYEHIAIALDGSPAALTAAAFARHLDAAAYQVIHIVESGIGGAPGGTAPGATARQREQMDRLEAQMRADVVNAMGSPDSGLPLSVEIRYGDPVEELLAASVATDLLLLTTRGRGIASRTLFGSVADEVSRRASRPTLILRPDHDLRRPERVLVLLDGHARAERAIPTARRLARTIGCSLVLVHVVDEEQLDASPFGPEPGDVAGTDAISLSIDRAGAYLSRREQELEAPDFDVQHRVVIGETVPALIEFADPADVVVIGSRARAGLRRIVAPGVAERMVRFAPSPVLIVHDGTDLPTDRASAAPALSSGVPGPGTDPGTRPERN